MGEKERSNQKNTFAPIATNLFAGAIPWFDIYIHTLMVHRVKQQSQAVALCRKLAIMPILQQTPWYHTFFDATPTTRQQKNSKQNIIICHEYSQMSRSPTCILTQSNK